MTITYFNRFACNYLILFHVGDIEMEQQKFHQHKRPISIKNIDINKIIVSKKYLLVKQDLNISLDAKILKKLDLYAYFQK